MALFLGPSRWASTRKVKLIWILLEQETVSGSGISWVICKSAPHSRQTTTPASHYSVFSQAGCPSCRPTNSVKALKISKEKVKKRISGKAYNINTHTFNGPLSRPTRRAGTRKVKPIWILLEEETVSGSGISWAICKSALRSRQITMAVPYHSSFLQAGCPSCCPRTASKQWRHHTHTHTHV